MIPPPITDPSKPLDHSVMPTRWEHLSGPFTWYEWITGETEEGYDAVTGEQVLGFRIRFVGEIGAMVSSLAERGLFHRSVFLFTGEGGVGKTALEQLMARSFLAAPNGLEPCELIDTDDEGQEHRRFVLDENGKVLRINPPPPGKIDAVGMAFSRPGSTNIQGCQYFNSGEADKATVDKLMSELRAAPTFGVQTGKSRRVTVMGEIDQFTKTQVVSMKVGLDNATFPDHILFLADSNDPERIRETFGVPGMQRFKHVPIGQWDEESLAYMAQSYAQDLQVQFEGATTAEVYEKYNLLAEYAGGSVRVLLQMFDTLRALSQPITREMIERTAGRLSGEAGSEFSSTAGYFLSNAVAMGPKYNVGAFCARSAERQLSLSIFADGLGNSLLLEMPALVANAEVSAALSELYDLARVTGGPSLQYLRWAAAAHPLHRMASALHGAKRTAPVKRQARSGGGAAPKARAR